MKLVKTRALFNIYQWQTYREFRKMVDSLDRLSKHPFSWSEYNSEVMVVNEICKVLERLAAYHVDDIKTLTILNGITKEFKKLLDIPENQQTK